MNRTYGIRRPDIKSSTYLLGRISGIMYYKVWLDIRYQARYSADCTDCHLQCYFILKYNSIIDLAALDTVRGVKGSVGLHRLLVPDPGHALQRVHVLRVVPQQYSLLLRTHNYIYCVTTLTVSYMSNDGLKDIWTY